MFAAARVWRIQSLGGADLTLSSVITIRMNNTHTHTLSLSYILSGTDEVKARKNYRVFSDE
jgi:hypothetical protein